MHWPHSRRALFGAVALCLFGLTLCLAQESDEQAWSKFVSWLPSAPVSNDPGGLLATYRAHLVDQRTPPAAAGEELSAVRRMMRTHTDGWQIMFNKIYSSAQPGFSIQPNALLVSAVKDRPPGRALDVGMGQGRNSLFLALQGWQVTGFDVSDQGLAVARANAQKAGVKLDALLQSNEQFDFGSERWDLIVITYEPVPLTKPAYVQRLRQSLRPGGLVVIESFGSVASAPDRKPVDIDPDELKRAFAGFHILRLEDSQALSDWGGGKTRLVRLVAQK